MKDNIVHSEIQSLMRDLTRNNFSAFLLHLVLLTEYIKKLHSIKYVESKNIEEFLRKHEIKKVNPEKILPADVNKLRTISDMRTAIGYKLLGEVGELEDINGKLDPQSQKHVIREKEELEKFLHNIRFGINILMNVFGGGDENTVFNDTNYTKNELLKTKFNDLVIGLIPLYSHYRNKYLFNRSIINRNRIAYPINVLRSECAISNKNKGRMSCKLLTFRGYGCDFKTRRFFSAKLREKQSSDDITVLIDSIRKNISKFSDWRDDRRQYENILDKFERLNCIGFQTLDLLHETQDCVLKRQAGTEINSLATSLKRIYSLTFRLAFKVLYLKIKNKSIIYNESYYKEVTSLIQTKENQKNFNKERKKLYGMFFTDDSYLVAKYTNNPKEAEVIKRNSQYITVAHINSFFSSRFCSCIPTKKKKRSVTYLSKRLKAYLKKLGEKAINSLQK